MDNFGLVYAFMHAGVVNKLVLIFLGMISLYSWALIFSKMSIYKKLVKEYNEVSILFAKRELSEIKKYSKNNYGVYVKFIDFVLESSKNSSKQKNSSEIRFQSDLIISQSTAYLGNNLSNLASIANATPFIGLFGTVIGVINSFQKIGVTASASLSVIAPGISEALYATAIGLFVAIPSSISYNYFISKINQYTDYNSILVEQLIYIAQRD